MIIVNTVIGCTSSKEEFKLKEKQNLHNTVQEATNSSNIDTTLKVKDNNSNESEEKDKTSSALISNEIKTVYEPTSKSVLLGNSTCNYVYGGKVATDKEWQYFRLGILDKKVGICKIRNDNTQFTALGDGDIWDINVTDKYLYYIKRDNFGFLGGNIYRINKDGTGGTILLKGEYLQLMLIGDYLYFSKESDQKIYKMKKDGTGLKEFISDNCDTFLYDNGFIFTTFLIKNGDGGQNLVLAKYDIDNPNKKVIIAKNLPRSSNFGYLLRFFIFNHTIFYIDERDKHIYCMNGDGTALKKLNNIKVDTMLISQKGIIYCISNENIEAGSIIYSFGLDGKNVKKVFSGDYGYYYLTGIAGNYLYYETELGEGLVSDTGRIKIDGTDNEKLGDRFESN